MSDSLIKNPRTSAAYVHRTDRSQIFSVATFPLHKNSLRDTVQERSYQQKTPLFTLKVSELSGLIMVTYAVLGATGNCGSSLNPGIQVETASATPMLQLACAVSRQPIVCRTVSAFSRMMI